MRRFELWDRLRQNASYGVRQVLKNRAFTAVTVLTLALGIGATTAIFSVVDGILFRPLPFPEPEGLVAVWTDLSRRGGPVDEWMNYDDFSDVARRSRSLQAVGAWAGGAPTVTGLGDPEQIAAGYVTHGMFSRVLRVSPALGRGFAPGDDRPGSPGTVLLSDGFWRRSFGGDPRALGSVLTVNDQPFEVIGVLPAGFRAPFVADAELWMTLREDPADPSCPRGNACLRVVARLADGATLEAARAEADGIARQLESEYAETNTDAGFLVRPLLEDLVGESRTALLALLGAATFVLLIACANVANLVLARGTTRGTELAVRSALGAGRRRLAEQLLTESALLAVLGGTAGLALAWLGTDFLVSIAPPETPRLAGISVNGRVLAFALGATAFAGALFGIVPSLRAVRRDLDVGMREGGRGGGGGGARTVRARGALVSTQIALALMLLAGAGLLVRSLQNLRATDLGYRPEGVLTMQVGLPSSRYPDADALRGFVRELERRLTGLPGVSTVGATSWLPLTGFGTDVSFLVEGQAPLSPGQDQAVWIRRVTAQYPATMGMPLLEGRWLTRSDEERAPRVVVINETFARRYFPDGSPLGRRLNLGSPESPQLWEIVGVAADARYFGIRDGGRVSMYLSYPQAPSRSLQWVLRSTRDPATLAGEVRAAVSGLDPSLAVARIQPMESIVTEALGPQRFVAFLIGLFSGIAFILAIVGVYGVVSYGVGQRLREIGVRMALGARGTDIRDLVLRQSLRMVGLGLLAGLAGGLALTRLIENLLFGVSAADPWTYGVVVLLLTAVAAAAAAIPAARAARVDPIRVLRSE